MRTYLLDWMVQRPLSDPYKLIVSSDWGNLLNQQVKYTGYEHRYADGILVETIVNFAVVLGTPNQNMMGTNVSIPIKWNELVTEHQTTIKSFEATVLKDNESKITCKTPIL